MSPALSSPDGRPGCGQAASDHEAVWRWICGGDGSAVSMHLRCRWICRARARAGRGGSARTLGATAVDHFMVLWPLPPR